MFRRTHAPSGSPSRSLLLQCRMIGEPQASDRLETEVPLFAEVIVPRHLAGPFTYLVPTPLRPVLRVGHLVFVPFGRSLVQGAVIALTPHHPPAVPLARLKAIRTLVTAGRAVDIPPPLLRLAKAVAETYVAPWGQCLRLVLPPKSTMVDSSRIILTKEGRHALAVKESASPAAVQLLKRLKRRPLGIPLSNLCNGKDPAHEDILTSILDRGWARRRAAPTSSALFGSHPDEHPPALETVGPYVYEWQARIAGALENRQAARLLVQAAHTERLALLRVATARTLELGRKVLVITGETARAESLAAALVHPARATVVLHSMMPGQKRADIWERIRQNDVSVMVGTRAAVFLPLHPLGLIWIDREEDSALKEPMEPRYHARDVAWMRALEEQALLVLSSAHLSLETCGFEAPEHLLKAPGRPDRSPHIEVVDLRHENRATLLSTRLQEAMQEAIARRAGVLLFLNRKAYAGALVCRECGQVPRCTSCAVAFAFSRHKHLLFCHYCGTTHPIPDLCSACGSTRLQPIGEGTERVEEEVKRRFPSARVLRVDGETMRRPKEALAMWTRIRRREWDVLVGTQVLLRDDAVPSVGVVGAVQADAGLSLPDFRAAERTFHLLQDAATLVQPMSAGGRFIIQSYLPTHHVIEAVARQEEAIFTSEELKHRKALGFPPAVRVIVLHISGALEATVEEAAQAWAAALSRAAAAMSTCDDLTILGPVPSPVPRVRGRYRRQILIKSRPGSHAIGAIRSTLTDLESAYARRKVKFDVDVDPIEMW
jgi:primosomal protein N' (replication factor Y) (superfamily II helicase)